VSEPSVADFRPPRTRLRNRSRALRALAELAYSVPDPLETETEARRYVHDDLRGLSLRELEQEAGRLHLRVLLDPAPPYWLTERERMIEIELLHRRTEA